MTWVGILFVIIYTIVQVIEFIGLWNTPVRVNNIFTSIPQYLY